MMIMRMLVEDPNSDETEDDFVHPTVNIQSRRSGRRKEDEKANDDDEVSSDQMVSTPPDYEISDEEENQEDDDNVMGGEQEDEEDEELYGDLNLNLDKRDAEMTDAQTNQETEEVIDSILNPNVQSDIPVNVLVSVTTETPSSDTIIPQPPIPIIQSQQQTHDSTTTTTIPTTTLPEIPNFESLFGFERSMKDAVNVVVQLKSNKLREEVKPRMMNFLNR
ncbi:hypothetical protein Tco_0753217 [Tanacetum coccineum]